MKKTKNNNGNATKQAHYVFKLQVDFLCLRIKIDGMSSQRLSNSHKHTTHTHTNKHTHPNQTVSDCIKMLLET